MSYNKIIAWKIMFLLTSLMFILCACSNQPSSVIETSSQLEKSTETPPPPLAITPKYYGSVDELAKNILDDFSEEKIREIEQVEAEDKKGTFRDFITSRIEQNSLYTPYFQDSPLVLREGEEHSGIAVFPKELYGQPWTWFYPQTDDGTNSFIGVMYLDALLSGDEIITANENGAKWLMNQINPNGVNSEKLYPPYDETYEKEVTLQNKTVTALIGNFDNDPRINIWFVYDNILVKFTSMPESAYELLKGLSFELTEIK